MIAFTRQKQQSEETPNVFHGDLELLSELTGNARRALRARHERPRSRYAAEQRDEPAPLHVLTLTPRIGPYHIGTAAAGDSTRLTWLKQRGRTRVKQRG